MGSEGLERILGKAVLDKNFLKELKNDPVKAAQLAGASLTGAEIDALKSLDLRDIDSFDQVTMDRVTDDSALHLHYHHHTKPLALEGSDTDESITNS